MKHKPNDVVILFSDETPFSLNEIVASNNSTYLAEAAGAADDDIKFIPKASGSNKTEPAATLLMKLRDGSRSRLHTSGPSTSGLPTAQTSHPWTMGSLGS